MDLVLQNTCVEDCKIEVVDGHDLDEAVVDVLNKLK